MKKTLALCFALIAWFAIIAQYYLMLENRVESITETTIRFFSFFTILTNILVAIYFTVQWLRPDDKSDSVFNRPGTLTALTVYITVVGLVYQIVLRGIWEPTGLQMLVDELLHSFTPLFVIVFWYLYEKKLVIKWNRFLLWFLYPSVYLVYILFRGNLSMFYPYPFIDVSKLGWTRVIFNSAILILLFVLLSLLFIGVKKLLDNFRYRRV